MLTEFKLIFDTRPVMTRVRTYDVSFSYLIKKYAQKVCIFITSGSGIPKESYKK